MAAIKLGLVLICGPPGAGKSTFLRTFVSFNTQSNSLCLHVPISYDNILDSNLERDLIQSDKNEWKLSRAAIRSLIKCVATNLSALNLISDYKSLADHLSRQLNLENRELNQTLTTKFVNSLEAVHFLEGIKQSTSLLFIVDDLFYYESMRYEYYKMAVDCRASLYFSIFFKAPDLSFLYERNRARSSSDQLSESIIENVFTRFEYPNKDWEISFSLTQVISNEQQHDLESFRAVLHAKRDEFEAHLIRLDELRAKQENDLRERELNRSLKNLVHECDLCLRRLIGDELKATDANARVERARELNARKSTLLAQLKLDENSSLTRKLSILFDSNDLKQFETHLREKLFETR